MKNKSLRILLILLCVVGSVFLAACHKEPIKPSQTEPPAQSTTTPAPNCTKHTFAAGSSCEDDRTCTVCGTVVPAADHAFPSGIACTSERTCTECGMTAVTGHTFSIYETCELERTCTECGITLQPSPHVFAEGSICTDIKVCTSCHTRVGAYEHTFDPAALCTEERTCLVCKYTVKANPDHTPGQGPTCGTDQLCIQCNYVFTPKTGKHTYSHDVCTVCLTPAPPVISSILIAGNRIDDYTIVLPEEQTYERYIASLLQHRVHAWYGVKLNIVTDNAEKSGHEIRIGLTNRTASTVGDQEYFIGIVKEDLEIVCNGMYGFEGVIDQLCEIFRKDAGTVRIMTANKWRKSFTTPDKDKLDGDVRIMFHNVYLYKSGGIDNVSSRFGMFCMLYNHYRPDIIGMQEANNTFFSKDNGAEIKSYLLSMGYRIVNDGKAVPLYYNAEKLEVLERGYEKGSGGNYGTGWAIFRVRETGKVFGAASSHFAANSVATDAAHANQLRINDAKALTLAKGKMLTAAKKLGLNDTNDLPIIVGGDYNCRTYDDPIKQIVATEASGFVNVKEVVTDRSKVDTNQANQSAPVYVAPYDYFLPSSYKGGQGTNSIDHIYCYAANELYEVNQYRIATNDIACGAADHLPHYVDITLY